MEFLKEENVVVCVFLWGGGGDILAIFIYIFGCINEFL